MCINIEKINCKNIDLSQPKDNYIAYSPNIKSISNVVFDDVHLENLHLSSIKNLPKDIDSISVDHSTTSNVSLVFENCEIKCLTIQNYSHPIEFKNCTFKKIEVSHQFLNIIFDHCTISDFKITNYHSPKEPPINNQSLVVLAFLGGTITTMNLYGLINFTHRLYINPQSKRNDQPMQISILRLEACHLMDNFKLHNAVIDEVEITDVNFESNADFFKSVFKKGVVFDLQTGKKSLQSDIEFASINFRGMALFDSTLFEQKLVMQYATFEKTTNFRNATFREGIDLDKINSKEGINFFNISGLNPLNTSQESFRIIKHNLKEIDNTIEANHYHSLELNVHRKNIKIFNNSSCFPIQSILDWAVSSFHFISSNYSKNWLLSLAWMACTSIGTNWYLGHNLSLECIFKYINILTTVDDFDQSYIAMTLNKVTLGYLYYQFLTAVRINTKE
ncbi:pentapeptide repeat-containing protein [Sulfurospirillum cavolei]|uniref:pentapeptide repeat-containing protein n=1 Tax=Sulfurospirillum cavolei TaxID=366522 RepID=UPI0005A644F6|nr:pentapeptide repeat-containing protein [Sulfurospirillum cavolei]